MKIKFFLKNLTVILLVNLLIGCSTQLTHQGQAQAQDSPTETQPSSSNTTAVDSFKSKPEEFFYKTLVAEIASQRGQFALSAEYFLTIAESVREGDLAQRSTRVALYAQEYVIALKAARIWVELEPANPEARQILVGLLLREGSTEEAIFHLESLLETVKNYPEQHLEVITALLEQQKDNDKVLELLSNLVRRRAKDVDALLIYARLLIAASRFEEAGDTLRKLLNVSPDHIQAVPLYALVLDKQHKTSDALKWLRQAVYEHPTKQEWRLIYARMLAGAEKFDEAIKQFRLLLSEQPQQAEILLTVGVLYLQTEKPKIARQYFTEMLQTGEQADTARYYLGLTAEMEKNRDEALSWYNKVSSGENFVNAQARIAVLLVEQGHFDKALKHLHDVPVNTLRDATMIAQFEAELLIKEKRLEEAMAVYNRALGSNPSSVELLYSRAMLAEKMNQLDLVEKDLRRVLELDPKNFQAINALGYTLADRTDRYQEAYELIKQALALSTDDYFILDSMGWVLYRMGQYEQAIEYLRRAQAKRDDPEVAAHLGEVLWSNGQKEEARKVWEKARETFPEDEKLREVIKRFIP